MKGAMVMIGAAATTLILAGLGVTFWISPQALDAARLMRVAENSAQTRFQRAIQNEAADLRAAGTSAKTAPPAGGKVADGKPVDSKPEDAKPGESKPGEPAPTGSKPADTPTAKTDASPAPAKDAPAKETPAKETPAKETPAKETPKEAAPLPAARPLALLISPRGTGPALAVPTDPPPPDLLGADGKPLASPEAALPVPWSVEVGLYASQERAAAALKTLQKLYPASALAVWLDGDQTQWFTISIPNMRPQQADSLARSLRAEGYQPVTAVPMPPPAPAGGKTP